MTLNIRSRENSGVTKKFCHLFSCAFNTFSFVPLDAMSFFIIILFSFHHSLSLSYSGGLLDVMLKARSKAMPGGRRYKIFILGSIESFGIENDAEIGNVVEIFNVPFICTHNAWFVFHVSTF